MSAAVEMGTVFMVVFIVEYFVTLC